ncbi:MAG: mechanosensitive ion channel family protein [Hyphomicrobiales bacterium]|nr:mechanosensitive ion channel family protein [Hyphomicrobiales bacterium]
MDQLHAWLTSHYAIGTNIAFTFLVVLGVLILNYIINRLINSFVRRAAPARNIWRIAILESLDPPLRAAVWIVGLTLAVGFLTRGGGFTLLSQSFQPARDIAVIAVAVWFLLRAVGRVETGLQAHARRKGQEIDPTAADAIGKLVRAAVIITAILVAMQTLGFSISGILAFGGIGGIAIGFAAQGLVANLFGGLTVYASRPFKVGEWIVMPGTDVMGEVQNIGWRATRVMGFDRRPFYVPNALFNTAVLINHSRMTARRIQETLHLRYRDIDRVEGIVTGVNGMLSQHPAIHHDFFVFRFDSCGEFALKLFLYAFTVTTSYDEYMAVKEDILLKIAAIVRQHGAELAVPTSTIHMPDGLRLQPAPSAGPERFIESAAPQAG